MAVVAVWFSCHAALLGYILRRIANLTHTDSASGRPATLVHTKRADPFAPRYQCDECDDTGYGCGHNRWSVLA